MSSYTGPPVRPAVACDNGTAIMPSATATAITSQILIITVLLIALLPSPQGRFPMLNVTMVNVRTRAETRKSTRAPTIRRIIAHPG